jgi:endonuclease/exonuclease/phosphatase family metal-dependent hydrolase
MRIPAPLLALSSVLLLAAAPVFAQDRTTVRVGTWNIENLGSRRNKRTEEDYVRLAKYILSLKVDVLGVQEINGAAPLARLCKHLGKDWSFVVGTSGKIGRRSGGGRQITVGFLFNKARMELISAHELKDLPRKQEDLWIFHRLPLVAAFRERKGGIDFRAVVVHFKAGRLKVSDRSPKDSAKRQAEVKNLRATLKKLLSADKEDQDLLILGDYNADKHYPAWKALAKDFHLLKPVEAHRSIVYFDEQIDHIALSKGLVAEFVEGSCRIRKELYTKLGGDEWKAKYSDHIPLVFELDASKDQDPSASFTPPATEHRVPQDGKTESKTDKAEGKTPKSGSKTPKRWF